MRAGSSGSGADLARVPWNTPMIIATSGASAPPAMAMSRWPSAIARAASPIATPLDPQAVALEITGPSTWWRRAICAAPALPMIAMAVNGREACLWASSSCSIQPCPVAAPPLTLP